MRTIKCEPLTLENFRWFGHFANLLACDGPVMGDELVAFYRDMAPLPLGRETASLSVVSCKKRPMVMTEAEQHFYTAEAILPLNGDVVVFAAPSTNKVVPVGEIRAFRVPKGTVVTFDAGVWHKAPFPIEAETVNSLVILPPRTYANDCLVVSFPENETIEIIL